MIKPSGASAAAPLTQLSWRMGSHPPPKPSNLWSAVDFLPEQAETHVMDQNLPPGTELEGCALCQTIGWAGRPAAAPLVQLSLSEGSATNPSPPTLAQPPFFFHSWWKPMQQFKIHLQGLNQKAVPFVRQLDGQGDQRLQISQEFMLQKNLI